eukprot:TRINITY_DN6283_c0_g1_i1.p1 TRINITY_DN6283_c0_g1~~TRINITY_DN6283_c0_g1_i1.p1  ORF type:complete len:392 (-),score=55.93 TRINITY_DN6283_c0_g1_i1:52-1140(-)
MWEVESYSLWDCTQDEWIPTLCIRSLTFVAVASLTMIALLLSIYRLHKLSKSCMSYQLGVLYCALLQAGMLLSFYGYASWSFLHLGAEYLKLATFQIFGYFFSRSAVRLVQRRELRKQVVVPLSIIIFLIATALGVLSLLPSYAAQGCRSVPWVAFSALQFLFATLFCVVTLIILRNLSTRNSVSTSFRNRFTRPLATLALIYGFVSLGTLLFRVYLYISTMSQSMTCVTLLSQQPAWFVWTAMIFTFIDLVVPLWALIWYFWETVRPNFSISVIPATRGADDPLSDASYPPPTTRLEISASQKFGAYPSDRESSWTDSRPGSVASSYDDMHNYLEQELGSSFYGEEDNAEYSYGTPTYEGM